MPCEHKIDESARTTRFVPGKGLTGVCTLCGAKVIMTRKVEIKPVKAGEGKHSVRMKKKVRVPLVREMRKVYAEQRERQQQKQADNSSKA